MTETGTPLRYRVKDVAALLKAEPMSVYRYVREGRLSGMWPDGRGPGKKLYLRPGEVEAYAKGFPGYPDGGPAAAKAWRRANRIPEPKKAGK